METMLAAREDAATILKLYELRQEAVMRMARVWIINEFWPSSAEEVLIVYNDMGAERNAWFRQVTTYWEMAAALVNHGVLAPELFVDTNGEPFFLAAKFWPWRAEVRKYYPSFLVQLEKLCERNNPARQKLEAMQSRVAKLAAEQGVAVPEIQRPD